MHPILRKTFGGLSGSYYFRQLFFSLILAMLIYSMMSSSSHHLPVITLALFGANTLLYPYSRFVYERITGFILGENIFFVNALLMLATKAFTMMMCWLLAIFIAPVGLLFLYFYHSRAEAKQ